MKYDMIKYDIADRIWNAFIHNDDCINKHYESFRNDDSYCSSDRDRFVSKFFRRYVGMYIIFMDKVDIGSKIDNCFFNHEPMSIYDTRYRIGQFYSNNGESIIVPRKKYLHINSFRAVNEMYGCGYIEMSCSDVLGDNFKVKLNYQSLSRIQFKEITRWEFEVIARQFYDDRDYIRFDVTRFLTIDEMKERKIKMKNGPMKETVIVMARDMKEACETVSNAIEVKLYENINNS